MIDDKSELLRRDARCSSVPAVDVNSGWIGSRKTGYQSFEVS